MGEGSCRARRPRRADGLAVIPAKAGIQEFKYVVPTVAEGPTVGLLAVDSSALLGMTDTCGEGKIICPVCKGEVKRSTTNFPVELNGGFLIVKNVPADVCRQCGEVFIPDDVAASLEKTVEAARKNKAEIEIVSYEKVA